MQRTVGYAILLALTLVTSGCAQAVAGGPITFEATAGSVGDDALQQTGYKLEGEEEYTMDRTVDLPAVGERQVTITNHLATYSFADVEDEAGAEGSAGAFLVLSSPQAQVAGQGTNPLGRIPLKQLVNRIASRVGDESDMNHVGTKQITVLGATTKVEKYSSTTRVEGEEIETFVYVTRVGHGDDYLVGIGILPRQFENGESDIYDLMRGIEHDD